MGRKSTSGPGMNILDHNIFESLETNFWVKKKILKFFHADPDRGSGIFLTLDPGWKISDPGFGINILDPQHFFRQTFLGPFLLQFPVREVNFSQIVSK
jgi:hypothetical protein